MSKIVKPMHTFQVDYVIENDETYSFNMIARDAKAAKVLVEEWLLEHCYSVWTITNVTEI